MNNPFAFNVRYHVLARHMDDFETWVGIHVSFRDAEGKLFRLIKADVVEIDQSKVFTIQQVPEPAIVIPEEAAQALLEQLWRLGYRPVENKVTQGLAEAKEANLVDLRGIVNKLFALLGEGKTK